MDEFYQHPWRAVIVAGIEDVASPVNEISPHWDYLDTAIATMGTVSHAQVDLEEVRQCALTLLAETKDFRVVAHLLRTLQHGKKPQDIALALYLFAEYVEAFWVSAAPAAQAKKRLLRQVMLRFKQAQTTFIQTSTAIERDIALTQLTRLETLLSAHQLPVDDIQSLALALSMPTEKKEAAPVSNDNGSFTKNTVSPAPASPPPPSVVDININSDSDREWTRTLIRVAEILTERQPEEAISFRLRRHAVFSMLSEPVNEEGKTPLAPMPADRVLDYKANVKKASNAEWMEIEKNLTVMPFWLEGHYISACIAQYRNLPSVAGAIKSELQALLARIPVLLRLRYSDNSPFISEEMIQWLDKQPSGTHASSSSTADEQQLLQCLNQKGLDAALSALNCAPASADLREHFYRLQSSARLLSEAGYGALAAQQAEGLLLACRNITLEQWEPSFFDALAALQDSHSVLKQEEIF